MSENFEFGPLQTKWLEALESGKYAQGHRQLKNGNAYCCLGVLCELAELPFTPPKATGSYSWEYGFSFGANISNGYLPTEFGETVGLRGCRGNLAEHFLDSAGNGVYSLADCNDVAAMSFPEIAAYIRQNPKNVFTKAA